MKEKSSRRSFIKNVGISSISAAILPVNLVNTTGMEKTNDEEQNNSVEKKRRPYNK